MRNEELRMCRTEEPKILGRKKFAPHQKLLRFLGEFFNKKLKDLQFAVRLKERIAPSIKFNTPMYIIYVSHR